MPSDPYAYAEPARVVATLPQLAAMPRLSRGLPDAEGARREPWCAFGYVAKHNRRSGSDWLAIERVVPRDADPFFVAAGLICEKGDPRSGRSRIVWRERRPTFEAAREAVREVAEDKGRGFRNPKGESPRGAASWEVALRERRSRGTPFPADEPIAGFSAQPILTTCWGAPYA